MPLPPQAAPGKTPPGLRGQCQGSSDRSVSHRLPGRLAAHWSDSGADVRSDRAEPILPKAGEYIKFYSITKAEFDEIAAQEAAGTYVCKRHPRKEGAK